MPYLAFQIHILVLMKLLNVSVFVYFPLLKTLSTTRANESCISKRPSRYAKLSFCNNFISLGRIKMCLIKWYLVIVYIDSLHCLLQYVFFLLNLYWLWNSSPCNALKERKNTTYKCKLDSLHAFFQWQHIIYTYLEFRNWFLQRNGSIRFLL